MKAKNNPRPRLYDRKNPSKIRDSETKKVTKNTRFRDVAKLKYDEISRTNYICRDFCFSFATAINKL